jgi:hypothetical protein
LFSTTSVLGDFSRFGATLNDRKHLLGVKTALSK